MANIPPYPGNLADDFAHCLEHVVTLTTLNMRNAIVKTAGVGTIDYLLLIDEESLIRLCTTQTTVMAKMKLKTLKRWVEKEADIDKSTLDIQKFTPEVCKELQRELARTKKAKNKRLRNQPD